MLKTFFIKQYIEDHEGQYIGKYRYRTGFYSDEDTYKCRYYMIDETFRTIDIFIVIHLQNNITYEFSQQLNDRETNYIVVDIMKRLLERKKYPSTLTVADFDRFLSGEMTDTKDLTPIDYVNAFDYMKYHHDITQKTVDDFYEVFLPALSRIKDNHAKYLECLRLIMADMLYEYKWEGRSAKYLDVEYEFHLPYIKEIFHYLILHLDEFYDNAKEGLLQCISASVLYARFSFWITNELRQIILRQDVINDILDDLANQYILTSGIHDENASLGFSYLFAVYRQDGEVYGNVIKDYLRLVVNNTLVYANHDFDQEIGNKIVKHIGYDIIIELFQDDFNTFIFRCFPIADFPEEYKLPIRQELEKAVFFFAARMENEQYRLSSFEQTMNINRLMLDNYREWYT
ncbi:MAG: hypothetical protein J6P61_05175 [Erysipelotrichaceae bacterium]|nr:hypothetical protein [Erysipelotrichaceae bacterium]